MTPGRLQIVLKAPLSVVPGESAPYTLIVAVEVLYVGFDASRTLSNTEDRDRKGGKNAD